MKILMVSSYLPFPLLSGGQVRLYNLIKELSDKHEIILICEKRPYQTAHDISEVKKICKDVITVDRKKQWSLSNIFKAGTSSRSFLLTGHTHSLFEQTICEVLSHNSFDLIHVETYYVMENVLQAISHKPKAISTPIVLVEHNIEYMVYQRFMNRSPYFLRPLLHRDITKIKKEEVSFWKKANALVAVSRDDQKVMKKAGSDSFLIANGVDTGKFTFKPFEERFEGSQEKRILFLGDFTWIQNRDSVAFILKEVWPKFKQQVTSNKLQETKLWIVGRKIPDSIRNLSDDPDVLFDEESSSLSTEKIFQQAAFLLAPIRIGGGTSYKILEAMSCGTPVVTMHLSADALGAKDGHDILVGGSAQELAEKSSELLSDTTLYKSVSQNGRELVEKNYTWEEIAKELEKVYQKAVLY